MGERKQEEAYHKLNLRQEEVLQIFGGVSHLHQEEADTTHVLAFVVQESRLLLEVDICYIGQVMYWVVSGVFPI